MPDTTKHTPTPWEVASDGCNIGPATAMIQGTEGKSVLPGRVIAAGFNNQPANATRIVQCVNAMERVEHPEHAIQWAREAISKAIRIASDENYPNEYEQFQACLRALGG